MRVEVGLADSHESKNKFDSGDKLNKIFDSQVSLFACVKVD